MDSGNVGWGVRVDEMWSVVDRIGSSPPFRRAASVQPALAKYEAFPENWDGTTVSPLFDND